MDLTLSNTVTQVGKRIRWHYISLAAGLGVAAVLAANLGSPSAAPGGGSAAAQAPVTRAFTAPAPPGDAPTVVFYLVASEDQLDRASYIEASTEVERIAAGINAPDRNHVILTVRNFEEEVDARKTIDDAAAARSHNEAAVKYEVVDLRTSR
jgi:hypothetical protein